MTEIVKARWYPEMPPGLPDETDEQYTDRLTGADRTDRIPYDHVRNRQCSIGYHDECSERHIVEADARRCQCPCHSEAEQRKRVDCDEGCRAFEEPDLDSLDELRLAYEHWSGHGYLDGCSHAR